MAEDTAVPTHIKRWVGGRESESEFAHALPIPGGSSVNIRTCEGSSEEVCSVVQV